MSSKAPTEQVKERESTPLLPIEEEKEDRGVVFETINQEDSASPKRARTPDEEEEVFEPINQEESPASPKRARAPDEEEEISIIVDPVEPAVATEA